MPKIYYPAVTKANEHLFLPASVPGSRGRRTMDGHSFTTAALRFGQPVNLIKLAAPEYRPDLPRIDPEIRVDLVFASVNGENHLVVPKGDKPQHGVFVNDGSYCSLGFNFEVWFHATRQFREVLDGDIRYSAIAGFDIIGTLDLKTSDCQFQAKSCMTNFYRAGSQFPESDPKLIERLKQKLGPIEALGFRLGAFWADEPKLDPL